MASSSVRKISDRSFHIDLNVPPASRRFGGAACVELWRYPDDSDGCDPVPTVTVAWGDDGVLHIDDRPTQFVDVSPSHALFPSGSCVRWGISQIVDFRRLFVPTRILYACIDVGMTGVFPSTGCTVVGGDEVWQRGQRMRFMPSFGRLDSCSIATLPLYLESLISWSTRHQVLVFRE